MNLTVKRSSPILLFISFYLSALLPFCLSAQVPVSEEPFHKKVLENQYFRLFDIQLKFGDTTLFHSHSKPSMLIQLTSTNISTQVKGQNWIQDQLTPGRLIYLAYDRDSLVHRVTNNDTRPFHVSLLEFLTPYGTRFSFHQLSFPVLLDNDRAIAYRLDASSMGEDINSSHGPILAELIGGSEVTYFDVVTRKSILIRNGKYLYIPPANTFHFTAPADTDIDLVLLEIK
jgi:hypothetical protein